MEVLESDLLDPVEAVKAISRSYEERFGSAPELGPGGASLDEIVSKVDYVLSERDQLASENATLREQLELEREKHAEEVELGRQEHAEEIRVLRGELTLATASAFHHELDTDV